MGDGVVVKGADVNVCVLCCLWCDAPITDIHSTLFPHYC